MEAKPGDEIVVETNTVGASPRRGVIVEARGPMVRVHWDDGHETMFMPGSDCRVEQHRGERPRSLGCHIEVKLTEDDTCCEAVAMLVTGRGTFEARGSSRRHPNDPRVPMIGEELAIGRALDALARQLMEQAGAAIARHESEELDLLA